MRSVVQKLGSGATGRLEVDPQVSPEGPRCHLDGTDDVLQKPGGKLRVSRESQTVSQTDLTPEQELTSSSKVI